MRKATALLTGLLLLLGFAVPSSASTPGLTPTFGSPVQATAGFEVQITNYDASYSWFAVTSNCGVASVSATGLVKVAGLDPNTSVTLTVVTSKAGVDDGSETVTGSSNSLYTAVQLEAGVTSSSLSNYEADADGNLYAALNRGGRTVVITKSSDAGKTWTTLNTWTASVNTPQLSPQFTLGSGGKMAAIWQDGTSNVYDINVSTSVDSGSTWSTPVTINSGQGTQWPAIRFAPDGELITSWYLYDGVNFKVNSRRSSDDGATWTPLAPISDPAASAYYSVLHKASDGQIYATWAVNDGIRARLYDEQSDTWGPFGILNATGLDYSQFGSTVDRNGNVAFTWTQGSTGSKTLWMNTFDGTSMSAPTMVTSSSGYLSRPRLAFTDTHVSVVWESGRNSNNPITAKARVAQVSDYTWGTEQSFGVGSWELYQLGVTSFGPSSFGVRWLRDSGGTHYVLEHVVSTDNGSTWGSTETVSTDSENSYVPAALVTSNDEYALMWRVQNATPNPNYLSVARYSPTITLPTKELYLAAEMEAGATGSSLYSAVTYNGKIYYSASTSATGRELFSFDGTNVELVADLNPGSADGLYSSGGVIGVFNNKLFLKGDDGTTGFELYAYDGTSIDLIADVTPGASYSSSYMVDNLAYFGGLLFFMGAAPGISEGRGYVYDFATEQFQEMRDYFAGYTKRNFWDPIVFQGDFFFRATEPGQATKMIRYDGTTFTEVAMSATSFFNFVEFGDLLVGAGRQSDGIELWAFDGTTAYQVADLNPGTADAFPSKGVVLGARYYFSARTPDATNGLTDNELYSWDGLTAPVKEFDFIPNNPTATLNDWGSPGPFVAGSDGSLYFSANDLTNGKEFRAFSPCVGSPTLPLDLVTGSGGSGNPQMIGELDGTVYVGLSGTTSGNELYAYGVKPIGFTPSVFAPTYTINYDANGGTGTTTSSLSGGSITLSDGTGFAMTGKVLLGWDVSNTATTPTHALSDSYTLSSNVTLFAIWGDPPSTPTINPNLPGLDPPAGGGTPTAPSGGDLELKGKNLGGVTKAEVDEKDAEIKKKTQTSLTLGLPQLDPGLHDLTLTADFGRLTIQGAIRVSATFQGITDEAQATITAWTKLNASKTQVRMYAKDPVSAGKVQFMVNGKEIAWIRAMDSSDRRLLNLAGANYLMRTVDLKPGKNRFEILLNGERIFRATYSRHPER